MLDPKKTFRTQKFELPQTIPLDCSADSPEWSCVLYSRAGAFDGCNRLGGPLPIILQHVFADAADVRDDLSDDADVDDDDDDECEDDNDGDDDNGGRGGGRRSRSWRRSRLRSSRSSSTSLAQFAQAPHPRAPPFSSFSFSCAILAQF